MRPAASLVLLDGADSIGGIWAKERLYPGLKTNDLSGGYEFSDFSTIGLGLKDDEHIPGHAVHQYLSAFAERFGLDQRVTLNTTVTNAEYKNSDGWVLQTLSKNGIPKAINARKLVIATGLNSDPLLPDFPRMHHFGNPIFHSYDYAKEAQAKQYTQSIVVIGSAKSAMDVANANTAAGVQVHWIIRKSGHGMVWASPSRATPLRVRVDRLLSTRLVTWFSPCI